MQVLERSSIIFAFLLLAVSARSQVDRSDSPESGPPPKVKLGDHHSFELENGLKVVVVEDRSVPQLAFYLLLDHDPILEEEKKGYVSMTGSMLDRGTEERSRQDIAQKVDGMGASLRTSGNSIYANSLRKHSGDLLEIMADVLKNPSFPKEELGKLKKRNKSGIQQEKSDPSAIRTNVRKAVTYGKDHPYGEVETQASVDCVKVSDLRSHYKKYWRPNSSYLAVVGDVKPEKAERMVREHFSDWKKEKVPSHEYEDPRPPSKNKVALADKDGAVQSALSITYPVELQPGDDDVMPVKLMNSILGGGGFSSRLLKNIREDKGYTYGVFSNISTDRRIGSFRAGGSVATDVTDSALTQFYKEIEKLKKGGVTKKELEDHKDRMAGGFTLSLEDPQTIARYALNIDRYDLPKDHYRTYLKRLENVPKKAVDKAAKRYLKPDSTHIVVVGDEDSLMKRMGKFGPIQRYDAYGFKKGEKKKVDLPEDLTAKKVLENYEKAVGGEKTIKKVQELRRVYKGKVRGRTVSREDIYEYEEPGFFGSLFGKEPVTKAIRVSKGGQQRKVLFDGKNVYVKQEGSVDTLSGKKFEESKRNMAQLFPNRNYLKDDCEVELLGSEMVDGEKAVGLKITNLNGDSHKEYYSLESDLLLKKVEERSMRGRTVQIKTHFRDYKEFGPGVKFPTKIERDIGGMIKIGMKQKEVQINHGVADDNFKL